MACPDAPTWGCQPSPALSSPSMLPASTHTPWALSPQASASVGLQARPEEGYREALAELAVWGSAENSKGNRKREEASEVQRLDPRVSWGALRTAALGLRSPCHAGRLQCYSCDLLHREEGCNQTQSCHLSETFCKTLISQGNTGEWPP